MKLLLDNLDNVEVVNNAVEEMIRWSTPFVRMARTLTRDYEYHGKQMKEGQQIIMLYPPPTVTPTYSTILTSSIFSVPLNARRYHSATASILYWCISRETQNCENFLGGSAQATPRYSHASGKTPNTKPSSFIRGLKSLPVTFSAD